MIYKRIGTGRLDKKQRIGDRGRNPAAVIIFLKTVPAQIILQDDGTSGNSSPAIFS